MRSRWAGVPGWRCPRDLTPHLDTTRHAPRVLTACALRCQRDTRSEAHRPRPGSVCSVASGFRPWARGSRDPDRAQRDRWREPTQSAVSVARAAAGLRPALLFVAVVRVRAPREDQSRGCRHPITEADRPPGTNHRTLRPHMAPTTSWAPTPTTATKSNAPPNAAAICATETAGCASSRYRARCARSG